ncbi:MAG: dehydrogenase [SAR202 cluster bacterium]|nr:dehydrogenase [SAR202 cluster bacterium]
MADTFKVGLTRDFLRPDGSIGFGDIGLSALDGVPGLKWEFIVSDSPEITPEAAAGYDALVVRSPRVTRTPLTGASRLALVSRFGIGYDSADVQACTDNCVALSLTPGAGKRPMAMVALMLILATSHRLLAKDRIAREGRWGDRLDYMGVGLTERTLGIVGLGNIGRELARLVAPLEMRLLAADPYADKDQARPVGVEMGSLHDMLPRCDFVAITAALSDETRRLIGEREPALIKPSAFLINVARGPIADQRALTTALSSGRLQGAGLDVFEKEPTDKDDPILKLDNFVLGTHALGWTDEAFKRVGKMAFGAVLDLAAGRFPETVLNKEVADHPRFQARLAEYARKAKR